MGRKKTIDEIKAKQSNSLDIMKHMAADLGFDEFTGSGKNIQWDESSDGYDRIEKCDFTQEGVGFLHMVVSSHESTGRVKDMYARAYYNEKRRKRNEDKSI